MATWQFSMHLVPRDVLRTFSPDLRTAFRVDDGEVDDLPGWSTPQPVADLAERLSQVLLEVQCRDQTLRQWGPSDRTTVTVWYSDGRVDEIHARIDLREEPAATAAVIDVLASLAKDSDGWWVGGDVDVQVPVGQTAPEIRAALERSPAAHFVADPYVFLEKLRTKQ
jgi:hypothetical protein